MSQVNLALLEQRENLRINECIPARTALNEVGIPCCQGFPQGLEPVQKGGILWAKGTLELLA